MQFFIVNMGEVCELRRVTWYMKRSRSLLDNKKIGSGEGQLINTEDYSYLFKAYSIRSVFHWFAVHKNGNLVFQMLNDYWK